MFEKLIKITQKLNKLQASEILLQKSMELEKAAVEVNTTPTNTPPIIQSTKPKAQATTTKIKAPTISDTIKRTKSVLEPHYSHEEINHFSQQLEDHLTNNKHEDAMSLINGAKQRVTMRTAHKEILDHVHAGNWDKASDRVKSLMSPTETPAVSPDKPPTLAPGVTDPTATVQEMPKNTAQSKTAQEVQRTRPALKLQNRSQTLPQPNHIESNTPAETTAMAQAFETAKQEKTPKHDEQTQKVMDTFSNARMNKPLKARRAKTVSTDENRTREKDLEQKPFDPLSGLSEEERARLDQVKAEREQPKDTSEIENQIRDLEDHARIIESHTGKRNSKIHEQLKAAKEQLEQLKPQQSNQRTRNIK